MTRFFYPVSRKHHAVSMAIDFGMRFKMRNGFWTPEGLLAITGADGYHIEVAEESLHLLKPQAGDAVEFDRWHWDRQRHEDMKNSPYKPHYGSVIQGGNGEWLEVVSAGVGWDTTFGGHRFAMQHKIIQRNGLPFHWPEKDTPCQSHD